MKAPSDEAIVRAYEKYQECEKVLLAAIDGGHAAAILHKRSKPKLAEAHRIFKSMARTATAKIEHRKEAK